MDKNKKRSGGSADFGDAKIDHGHDWGRIDRTKCEKEPGMDYRHCDPKKIKQYKAKGWIVDDSQESELDEMILMKIPEERLNVRRRRNLEQARRNQESAEDPAQLGPTGFRRKL
jgi:hypothetical protein